MNALRGCYRNQAARSSDVPHTVQQIPIHDFRHDFLLSIRKALIIKREKEVNFTPPLATKMDVAAAVAFRF